MRASEKRLRAWPRTLVIVGVVLLSAIALWIAIDAVIHGRMQLPGSPVVGIAALILLAAAGAAFTVTDLTEHRLPNALMLSSYAAALACIVTGWLTDGDSAAAIRAGAGAIGLFIAFALLSFARPGGMGGGDVKLAGLLGGLTAWASWEALVVCFAAAFICAGVVALAGLLLGRLRSDQALPFGPFLILGGWCGLLLG